MTTSLLKKWLRKEDAYDTEFESVLTSQGINDPTKDFKNYTQAQYDDFYNKCVVQRAKDIKDQKAKVRLQKKMTKVEKYWRKQSGIKSTSIKKGGKGKKTKAKTGKTKPSSEALRKFLLKEECMIPDLLDALVARDIYNPEDIVKIDSNTVYDAVLTEVRVARAADLKSAKAKNRMEKKMIKFEKIWRKKTKISKSSSQTKSSKSGKGRKSAKAKKNEKLTTGSGKELKIWMKKQKLFEISLFGKLLSAGVTDFESLKNLGEADFDKIVREVRVDRFSELKDQKSRNRVDKLLISFEKQWREATGIKKTSLKKKKKGKKSKTEETAAVTTEEAVEVVEEVVVEEEVKAEDVKVEEPESKEEPVIAQPVLSHRSSALMMDEPFSIGDRIMIKPSRIGQIKFIGEVKEFGCGMWYGIRLTEERGDCDGEFKEVRKFRCPKNCGVYVNKRLILERVKDKFDFMSEESSYAEEAAAKAQMYKKEISKLKELKKMFSDADTDGNGLIDRDEFSVLGAQLFGGSRYEVEQLFKEVDVTNNGTISLAEFGAFVEKQGGSEEEVVVEEVVVENSEVVEEEVVVDDVVDEVQEVEVGDEVVEDEEVVEDNVEVEEVVEDEQPVVNDDGGDEVAVEEVVADDNEEVAEDNEVVADDNEVVDDDNEVEEVVVDGNDEVVDGGD